MPVEFDPAIHLTRREHQREMDALEGRLAALEKANKDALEKADKAAEEAKKAKDKAVEEAAKAKAAQDAAEAVTKAAQDKAVLASVGITDPVDQANVLAAHQARGGKAPLEDWVKEGKDRAVARILADTAGKGKGGGGEGDNKTKDPGKGSGGGDMKAPNGNAGAKGETSPGTGPKVVDRLGELRTIKELRENRDSYLKEFMGDGYTPPPTKTESNPFLGEDKG